MLSLSPCSVDLVFVVPSTRLEVPVINELVGVPVINELAASSIEPFFPPSLIRDPYFSIVETAAPESRAEASIGMSGSWL